MLPQQQPEICPYFLKGKCKYVNKCKNIHSNNINPHMDPNQMQDINPM